MRECVCAVIFHILYRTNLHYNSKRIHSIHLFSLAHYSTHSMQLLIDSVNFCNNCAFPFCIWGFIHSLMEKFKLQRIFGFIAGSFFSRRVPNDFPITTHMENGIHCNRRSVGDKTFFGKCFSLSFSPIPPSRICILIFILLQTSKREICVSACSV